MIKQMLVVTCIFTTFAHGMEAISRATLYGETTIRLTQGTVFDADTKRGFIVVGGGQQRMMRQADDFQIQRKKSNNQIVYVKKNDSDDIEKKTMESIVLRVIEPKIVKDAYWDEEKKSDTIRVSYTREERTSLSGESPMVLFFDDQAIKEGLKDLALCYENILKEGMERIKEKPKKEEKFLVPQRSIALPLLSTEFNFSREDSAKIAGDTIVKFVQEYPNAYTCIELFIDE